MDTLTAAPETEEQKKTDLLSPGAWSDANAKDIVTKDFRVAEAYRYQNHDWRWQAADEVYLAWVKKKTWQGTKIPRSSLPVFLAYQQIEALLPQAMDALFGGDLDFDVIPSSPLTTLAQALQVRYLINYQLQNIDGERPKFNTLRELFRRAYKQALIYGNGLGEFGWIGGQKTRSFWERKSGPEMMPHPLDGTPVPTGAMTHWIEQSKHTDIVSQPFLLHRDLRDFYIDPNTPSPNVQEGGFCATRILMPIDQLEGYRNTEGFNIPDVKRLAELAKKKHATQGDTTKSITESYRGGSWSPTIDQSKDPRLARVEVIRYWQPGRHVWMLGREDVAFNGENRYGCLPFLSMCYTDVIGRWYGLSICDIVEGDQKLAEAIINARVDELNLIIHSPLIKRRGSVFATSGQGIRPGIVWEVDDVNTDIKRMEMGNVTQQAFIEVDALERRVQTKTGVTDLAVLGAPSSGGNSANRTATGVASQTNASNSRIHYQVANIEDQFFLPMLNILLNLNKNFLDPSVLMQILGPDGAKLQLDPVDVLNSDVRFEMKTSQRMKARAGLQGGGMMAFMQYFMNPEWLQMMSEQQNKTVDVQAITDLFCDTYNQRSTEFLRNMTPQEQQSHQQRQMAPMLAKQQLQDSRLTAMASSRDETDETKLLQTLITTLGQIGALNDLTGVQRDAEIKVKSILDDPENKGDGNNASTAA